MRLKTSIWVAAYLRRCQAAGVFGAVRRRGAEEAGAVFVKVALLDAARKPVWQEQAATPPKPSSEFAASSRLTVPLIQGAADFSQPAPFTFGNVARNLGNLRGPGRASLDFSSYKDLAFRERLHLQIRGEAFNLSNTPIFSSPASQTITSTLFGQIRGSQGERNMQIVGKFYF